MVRERATFTRSRRRFLVPWRCGRPCGRIEPVASSRGGLWFAVRTIWSCRTPRPSYRPWAEFPGSRTSTQRYFTTKNVARICVRLAYADDESNDGNWRDPPSARVNDHKSDPETALMLLPPFGKEVFSDQVRPGSFVEDLLGNWALRLVMP